MDKRTADVTTSSGFTCTLDLNRVASMNFVDAMADYQDGDILSLSRAVAIMFDKETKNRLYEHVRNGDGLVPLEDVAREIIEILNGAKQGKNS